MRSSVGGRFLALCGLSLLSSAPLAAQAPSTDVWLAPLSRVGDSLVVGTPRNLTNRPGYDNQPSFTPDSRAILYTSIREDGQADIYRYDLASGAITRLTSTPESEYSPTATPDGKHFSVVRVERDSTQRLWRFPLAGGEPSLVLEQVKPVGYHAWVDDTTLALFVLGQPATLQLATVRDGAARVVASNIGRSLARGPQGLVTYVQRDSTRALVVERSAAGGDARDLVTLASRAADFVAWTPTGDLLTGRGAGIDRWNGRRGAAAAWLPVAEFSGATLRNVSRLAVSPDGRWLAFVAEASAP